MELKCEDMNQFSCESSLCFILEKVIAKIILYFFIGLCVHTHRGSPFLCVLSAPYTVYYIVKRIIAECM